MAESWFWARTRSYPTGSARSRSASVAFFRIIALPEPDGSRKYPYPSPVDHRRPDGANASRLIRTFLDDIFPGNRIAVDDLVADLTLGTASDGRNRDGLCENAVSSSLSRYSGRADLFARPGHCGPAPRLCAPFRRRGRVRHPHLTHSRGNSATCDRIVVMGDGRVMEERPAARSSKHSLVEAMGM